MYQYVVEWVCTFLQVSQQESHSHHHHNLLDQLVASLLRHTLHQGDVTSTEDQVDLDQVVETFQDLQDMLGQKLRTAEQFFIFKTG